MGTRADFYLGDGVDAEWLGSVAWDGYEFAPWERDHVKDHIHDLADSGEADYRESVEAILLDRPDATTPEMGWPWPWHDSRTTDFAYCYVDGRIDVYIFGCLTTADTVDEERPSRDDWPTFGDDAVTLGPRSGLIIVQAKS